MEGLLLYTVGIVFVGLVVVFYGLLSGALDND